MYNNCRKAPPEIVCIACFSENDDKCTKICRDAFVYDEDFTVKQKLEILKSNYKEGGKPDGLTMGVKIPENLMILLMD